MTNAADSHARIMNLEVKCLKIGVIGLGNIARKAYLPVLATRTDLELHFMTRTAEVLAEVSQQYRVLHTSRSLDELVGQGIEAAFVHAATTSHYDIVTHLLQHGIHVFVDKPLDLSLDRSEQLVRLAADMNLSLMVGFNRRFAPAYHGLQERHAPQLVVMQKNRAKGVGDTRDIIYDDFIHVVDTLRFYLQNPVDDVYVQCEQNGQELVYLVVHLVAGGKRGIGIMHRQCGVNEEILETFGDGVKCRIDNVRQVTRFEYAVAHTTLADAWSTTYKERGFESMVDHFIKCIDEGTIISAQDALETHRICENIVNRIVVTPN